jgi:hypothetical protein
MKYRNIFLRAWEQFFGLKMLKFFDAGPDPGSRIFLTLDPGSGMKKLGSGIQDKHPRSATLVSCMLYLPVYLGECRVLDNESSSFL